MSLKKSYLLEQPPAVKTRRPQPIHRILVFGAGVLGSLYAGRLHQAGYEVTLLARGKRLEELREHGLILVEESSQRMEQISVQLTDRLAPEDAYDLVIVLVRKDQLPTVLPSLAANHHTPNVLFMVNSAGGPGALVEALGHERVLLGFPGAGGQREDGIVHYQLTHPLIQSTTIGELDGQPSNRLSSITRVLQEAGFPVAVSQNMDAWLKTHVALVSPIANAIYLTNGSNYRLAHTRDGLVLMSRAVKEGFRVLRALGVPITPARYRLLPWLPEPLVVAVLQKGFDTKPAELVMARHANSARDEMLTLAQEFRALANQSGVATPAIDELFGYLDPAAVPLSEGQASISMNWGPTIAGTGALVFLGWLFTWLLRKRRT